MNNKRPHNGEGYGREPKRHHSSDMDSYRPSNRDRDYDRRDRDYDRSGSRSDADSRGGRDSQPKKKEENISHADAVTKLPKGGSGTKPQISGPRDNFNPSAHRDTDFPVLPPIKQEYQAAVFTHKSSHTVSRTVELSDTTYEKLEFLGDAYIEIIATRVIFDCYSFLPAGRMSQVRELLVKNETLAEYALSYGFDKKVKVGGEVEDMKQDSKGRGNKGWTKILGDVVEAYVAAIIMSDHLNGFDTAEKWLTALWAPKLLSAAGDDRILKSMSLQGQAAATEDKVNIYDSEAKATLQKRITYGSEVRLTYETDKPTVELKGDRKGQNIHFIALYVESEMLHVTRRLLAKAEGRNKVEAGNWAAVKAMYGSNKEFIDDMETRLKAEKDRRRSEREAKDVKVEAAMKKEPKMEEETYVKIEKVAW